MNEVYTPPTLGEDRERRLGYSKGVLGVPHPPPVTIGSEPCIEGGETFPPSSGRTLIAGVDCRCWTSQGLPCPDQAPWLWYTPESIVDAGSGLHPIIWKDTSPYGNNARIDNLASPPLIDTSTDFTAIRNNFVRRMLVEMPLRPLDQWSVYMVATFGNLTTPGTLVFRCFGTTVNTGLVIIRRLSVSWNQGQASGSVATTTNAVDRHLWSIRRSGTRYQIDRDGVELVDGICSPGGLLDVNTVGPEDGLHPTVLTNLVYELALFPSRLSDTQHGAFVASLMAKYGIP